MVMYMATLRELEKRVAAIEGRNARVEADKAWETSLTRRGLLVLFIYLAIGTYFWAISLPYPWLNAIVPAAAFLLSTLTIEYLKKMWLAARKR